MKEDLFNNIIVPDFVSDILNADDWYLSVAKFIELINNSFQQSHLESSNETLKYNGIVHIGKNCRIGHYVVIDGPVYIGDNVEIGPHVNIRAGSIIGNNCVIAHAAEIKNSLLMEGSKVANHVFVGDSIVGSKARFGGHSETANRRFDQSEISLAFKDNNIQTKLTKYGVILGEGSRLGGDVFTSPGTVIGKNSFIATGVKVGGYAPSNTFVKEKSELEFKPNNFSGELHNKSKLYE